VVNRVILIGRLTKAPEVRNAGGSDVCNFSLAVNERWTDKGGGTKERTNFFPIVVWGKLAGVCSRFLDKGSLAYVEGRLQTRQWEKDGVTRYTTEIHASSVQFLERKGSQGDPVMGDEPAPEWMT
jgi:single-strand DNA-binding protein